MQDVGTKDAVRAGGRDIGRSLKHQGAWQDDNLVCP